MANTFSRFFRSWVNDQVADIGPELQAWRLQVSDVPLQLLLFYAVYTSNSKLVDRLLEELGHNWEGEHTTFVQVKTTPVLAIAVVQRGHEMVYQLLSRGADSYTIPADCYMDPMSKEGLHGIPSVAERFTRESAASWCTLDDKDQLRQALDIEVASGFTMCYWLARAAKLPKLTTV